MRVHVDPSRCQGHNRCVLLAPGLFETDDQGFAREANPGLVPPELEALARRAAANCPELAILLDEGP